MEKYYTTGQFAKIAGVTLRTIRYYDKIGLLKPSHVLENGYRQYCKHDLITLQKILALKELGFSLEEIYPLIIDNDKKSFQESLKLQTSLIDQKINHLNNLKNTIKNTEKILNHDDISWEKIIELINLTNNDEMIIQQYLNSQNLSSRIYLHEHYSINKESWFPWLFNQIDFSKVNRLLEIGCGNGKLWENNHYNLRNREIFLSDCSHGMVEDAKKLLGNDYNYLVLDCHSIPFKSDFFDTVIANHVLFYLYDLNLGLEEIARVLKDYGVFYCTTYGKNHMIEITQIVHQFDSRIQLSKQDLVSKFGLENGKELLEPYFKHIELKRYNDYLIVDDAKALIDYIMSCHGNQREFLGHRLKEFQVYIENLIKENHGIKVTKDCGLFICQK